VEKHSHDTNLLGDTSAAAFSQHLMGYVPSVLAAEVDLRQPTSFFSAAIGQRPHTHIHTCLSWHRHS
jgi:hypothetical protein